MSIFAVAIFLEDSAVFHRIILQDKLYSFNIQEDRSTRFPCTSNYKNNNKRFYPERIRNHCKVTQIICLK